MAEKMWIVDSGFAYGALIIRYNRVQHCAPIFYKWFHGKTERTVKEICKRKGWKLNEDGGRNLHSL